VGSITGSPVDYGTGPKKLWNLLNRYLPDSDPEELVGTA
jgi:hypothetical protein